MNTSKIIILDFSTTEVHVFPYDNNVWDDCEDFITGITENGDYSFSLSNCQWMVVKDLKIEIH